MIPAPGLRRGWNRFFFAPRSTAPIELFRIGFGLLATFWMLSMAPVLVPFFGDRPAVPTTPTLPPGAWTLFTLASGGAFAWLLWLLGLLAAVAVTVGLGTRLAAVVVFVVLTSLTRHNPWIFNSGDVLVRVLAFYLVLMPAGSAISLDRLRSDRAGFWTFPRRAPWALRLAQIQLSVIYLSTVWEKSGGVLWRDGSAVSYSLRVLNVSRFAPPAFVTDSVALTQLMTFGTLAAEAAIGILVWNRAARPWVLALGVLLHLSIDISLMIGFFSAAMFVLYLSFVTPEAAERVVSGVARRARRGSREPDGDAGTAPGDGGRPPPPARSDTDGADDDATPGSTATTAPEDRRATEPSSSP